MSVQAPAASHVGKAPAGRSTEAEEVDAISEADLFLNFGRDVQAEEVLKEALSKNPANIPVQLKLLSIYANRKDLNAFTTIARKLKDSGDTKAWEQAAALGRAVDSSNPMYEGVGLAAAAAATEALVESGKPGPMPAVDMDIGFNIPMDLDVTSAAHTVEIGAQPMDFDVSGLAASSMDLDVTGSRPSEPEVLLPDFDVTGGHPGIAPTERMDFDVTASHPNVVEAMNMDFDITGSQPNITAASSMDFDVTGSHPNVTEPLSMDFDVTGSHPSVAAPSIGAEETMSAAVLGSPMDFDISFKPSAPSAATEAPSSPGGMDFDISAPTQATSPAAIAATPSSGGMDFDLSSTSSLILPSAAAAPSGSGGMDFDISSAPSAEGVKAEPALDLGLSGISLDLGVADTVVLPVAEAKKGEHWQEVANKLDLARAFQEMGDVDTARELLGEVLNEGDEQQVEVARTLIHQL